MRTLMRFAGLGVLVAHSQIVEAQTGCAYLFNTRESPLEFEMKQRSTIPFRLDGGFLITVGGRIGTLGPLRFLLDTGATHTMISKKIAERLSLARVRGSVVNFDREVTVEWARVPKLEMGPIVVRDVRVMVAELKEFSEFAESVDAVVGLDVLRSSRSVRIDYDRREVTFRGAGEGPADGEGATVLTVRVPVQGRAVRLIVDTGMRDLLLYRDRLLAHVPEMKWEGRVWEASEGRLTGQWRKLPGIRLGDDELAAAMVLPGAPNGLPADIDGYLGTSVLRARAIELDFAGNRLTWE